LSSLALCCLYLNLTCRLVCCEVLFPGEGHACPHKVLLVPVSLILLCVFSYGCTLPCWNTVAAQLYNSETLFLLLSVTLFNECWCSVVVSAVPDSLEPFLSASFIHAVHKVFGLFISKLGVYTRIDS